MSDYLLPISSLNILIGNSNSNINTLNQQDLYLRSVENGYNQSFDEFSRYGGCVVILKPGIDFPALPGVLGQWSFTISNFTCLNTSSITINNIELDIWSVMDGQIDIMPNSASITMGINPESAKQALVTSAENEKEGGSLVHHSKSHHYGAGMHSMHYHGGKNKWFWKLHNYVRDKALPKVWQHLKPLVQNGLKQGADYVNQRYLKGAVNTDQLFQEPETHSRAQQPEAHEVETAGRYLAGREHMRKHYKGHP
jgi:hypothetical protein